MTLGDFTPQAADYSRSRPGYPDELVERLLDSAGAKPGDPVADLGAGTGLFTALLAARGLRVTAIEPNEAMRARAPDLPGVAWTDGTFEHTGLPAHSQQWAVAAQSFHWADPVRSLPELRRILRPDGALTILWNERDESRSDVLAFTRQTLERYVPGFEQRYHRRHWADVLLSTGDFAGVTTQSVPHVVAMTAERFLRLWRSNNHLSELAGPERLELFLGDLAAGLRERGLESIDVTYICRAWTARPVP